MEGSSIPRHKAFIFLADTFTATEVIVYIAISTIVSIFTMVSNATVVHLTRKSAELKPMGPLRALIGSMACADLLMGLVIMPLSCQLSVMKKWLLGPLGCKLFMGLLSVSCSSSILHLAIIAVDRYLAMVHPLRYLGLNRSTTYPRNIIVTVWAVVVVAAAPVFVIDLGLTWTDESGKVYCEASKMDTYLLPSLLFVVGLPIMSIWFIYIRLYCINKKRLKAKLKKAMKTYQQLHANSFGSNMTRSSQADPPGFEEECDLCMDRTIPCLGCQAHVVSSTIKSGLCKICRAPNDLIIAAMDIKVKKLVSMNQRSLMVMLIIVTTFTICWVPFAVVQVLANKPESTLSPRIMTLSMWLAGGNSAFNPIIYAAFNKSFRTAFRRLIGCNQK